MAEGLTNEDILVILESLTRLDEIRNTQDSSKELADDIAKQSEERERKRELKRKLQTMLDENSDQ